MTINTRAPEGNVFAILGAVSGMKRELEKAGCDVKEYDALLSGGYTKMTYDQILDEVTRITHGTIKFKGRKKPTDEEDEDEHEDLL